MGPPPWANGDGQPCNIGGGNCIPIDNGLIFLLLLIVALVLANFKLLKNEK